MTCSGNHSTAVSHEEVIIKFIFLSGLILLNLKSVDLFNLKNNIQFIEKNVLSLHFSFYISCLVIYRVIRQYKIVTSRNNTKRIMSNMKNLTIIFCPWSLQSQVSLL